jgi:hypothetical protein
MKKSKSLYHGHRFPAAAISCAVRWHFRFQLSLRDVEELLFERGVVVSYETIRRWCDKFGAGFARRVKVARPIFDIILIIYFCIFTYISSTLSSHGYFFLAIFPVPQRVAMLWIAQVEPH